MAMKRSREPADPTPEEILGTLIESIDEDDTQGMQDYANALFDCIARLGRLPRLDTQQLRDTLVAFAEVAMDYAEMREKQLLEDERLEGAPNE